MNEYFEAIEPFNIFTLKVSDLHTLHGSIASKYSFIIIP